MKKVAYITGCTGNLGKAVIAELSKEGYHIVGTVLPGEKNEHSFTETELIEVDLTNEKKSRQAVEDTIKKYGGIDIALLLVGGFAMGSIYNTDGTALKKMYGLNFETAYYTARPVFLQMMEQIYGGRIVLIGSRPSLVSHQGKDVLAYGLSKSLLFKLAEFLNAEGGKKNVVTSVIVPSIIDTPENRNAMPDADYSTWIKAEEIAKTIAFICSDRGKSYREPIIKLYGNS